ncbi:MAG: heme ABC exporter ATP-binding protein CcmA [Anaerolineae bacterium]|nr:heme ABC exporter ATP-binding protein CcmA [Anaerolineae bacterium]
MAIATPLRAESITKPSSAPLIAIEGVTKTFDVLPVLRNLTLHVGRGDFLALLGANGSGKSTLLRLVAGLGQADRGTIRVGGWQLPREAARVRAQLGLVSHKLLLYENLTARENLRFFSRLYNLHGKRAEQRIETLLERVGLASRADDAVRTFSRGMAQRLSIARALLHEPAILLLDEPYTGLDQAAAAMLDALLSEAHAEGRTIVMVTHEIERAARLPTHVAILARGAIAFTCARAEIPDAAWLAARYAEVTG